MVGNSLRNLGPLGKLRLTGFGAERSAWIDRSTVRIWSAGDHLSLRMSRQMRPNLSVVVCPRAMVSRVSPLNKRPSATERLTNVGMINLCQEANFRRRHRVVFGEEQFELEHATCGRHDPSASRRMRERERNRGSYLRRGIRSDPRSRRQSTSSCHREGSQRYPGASRRLVVASPVCATGRFVPQGRAIKSALDLDSSLEETVPDLRPRPSRARACSPAVCRETTERAPSSSSRLSRQRHSTHPADARPTLMIRLGSADAIRGAAVEESREMVETSTCRSVVVVIELRRYFATFGRFSQHLYPMS